MTTNTIKAYVNTIHTIDFLSTLDESFLKGFTAKSYKNVIHGCPLDTLRDMKIVVISRQEELVKEVEATNDGYYLFDDGTTFTWKSDAKDYFFDHPNQSFKWVDAHKREITIYRNYYKFDAEWAQQVRINLELKIEKYKRERIATLEADIQKLNEKIEKIRAITY